MQNFRIDCYMHLYVYIQKPHTYTHAHMTYYIRDSLEFNLIFITGQQENKTTTAFILCAEKPTFSPNTESK